MQPSKVDQETLAYQNKLFKTDIEILIGSLEQKFSDAEGEDIEPEDIKRVNKIMMKWMPIFAPLTGDKYRELYRTLYEIDNHCYSAKRSDKKKDHYSYIVIIRGTIIPLLKQALLYVKNE